MRNGRLLVSPAPALALLTGPRRTAPADNVAELTARVSAREPRP